MSNKDFTADFSEGEHHSPGLHDASIEPSGQGKDAIVVQLNKHEKELIKNEADNRYSVGLSLQRNTFRVGAQWGILHERQQTALLSRLLLRSEMKLKETTEKLETYIKLYELTNTQRKEWSELSIKFKTEIQAKDEEIQRLRKALEKFPEVIQQIDEALNPSSKTTKEDI